MGAVCGRPFYYPLLIQLSHSHSQSLPVPPSPSLSPSLQVSGANYAGTFEVTRARGTYPTSLPATLPPAKVRYGAVQRSAVVVRWAGPSPAQPSRPFLVPVVVSPSLSLAPSLVKVWSGLVKVSPAQPSPVSQSVQSDSQSVAVLVARSHPFIPSLSRSRTGLVPGRRVHAHLHTWTATLRPSVTFHLACTFLPNLPTPCLPAAPCTLHLVTIPPPSFPLRCVGCVWMLLMCACACACVSMSAVLS